MITITSYSEEPEPESHPNKMRTPTQDELNEEKRVQEWEKRKEAKPEINTSKPFEPVKQEVVKPKKKRSKAEVNRVSRRGCTGANSFNTVTPVRLKEYSYQKVAEADQNRYIAAIELLKGGLTAAETGYILGISEYAAKCIYEEERLHYSDDTTTGKLKRLVTRGKGGLLEKFSDKDKLAQEKTKDLTILFGVALEQRDKRLARALDIGGDITININTGVSKKELEEMIESIQVGGKKKKKEAPVVDIEEVKEVEK